MQREPLNRKGALIRICEIYSSVQGEGLLTGTPSVFVRTSGCNLRCWFCDTPFASWRPEGAHLTVDEILEKTLELNLRHIVITGGEPMIHRSLIELCRRLRAEDKHITIETAGTIDPQAANTQATSTEATSTEATGRELECDLISISPKLTSSAPDASTAGNWHAVHNARRDRPEIVRSLIERYAFQLKFVVDGVEDAEEVVHYIHRLREDGAAISGDRVLLMPQGVEQTTLLRHEQWLVPWCQEHGFRYCPRSHILWYGNRRGT